MKVAQSDAVNRSTVPVGRVESRIATPAATLATSTHSPLAQRWLRRQTSGVSNLPSFFPGQWLTPARACPESIPPRMGRRHPDGASRSAVDRWVAARASIRWTDASKSSDSAQIRSNNARWRRTISVTKIASSDS